MNQSFTDLCSEFGRLIRYSLSVSMLIPDDNVLKIMEEDGWKRVACPGFKDVFVAPGHGGIPMERFTVKDKNGRDGIYGNELDRARYKKAVRIAAAQAYKIDY